MEFPDDNTAGGKKTPQYAVWWGSSGIIYETIKRNFKKSFYDIYLFIYQHKFLSARSWPSEFSFLKFSYFDRNIYLFFSLFMY